MKRVAPFLIFLMLVQGSGYFLIFKVQQYQVRWEIKQQIKSGVAEENLTLLKIPKFLEEEPNVLFQRIHSKEFRYKGVMYDIIRISNHGDTTWYYCIEDVKESGLFAGLDNKIKVEMHHSTERKKQSEKVLRLLADLYLNISSEFEFFRFKKELFFVNDQFFFETWKALPLLPPPQV